MNNLGNKETMAKNIQRFLDEHGMSRTELANRIPAPYTTVSSWIKGEFYPRIDKIERMAEIFGVTKADLVEDYAPGVDDDVVTFSVIGDVAAGYDHIAYTDWEGTKIDLPRTYLHGRPATDYFALRVTGESMYPLYMDGDIVLVLKQPTMDRSGQIGVVVYDNDKATLKKIEYVMGEDWMKLLPLNPSYPPLTVTGSDLERCKVLGIPKVLIRENL